MVFNFKNKNIKIILLVLLVLASVACYSMMRRDVEGLGNMSSHFETNFKIYNKDYKSGTDNYFLNPYAGDGTEINFSTDTPLSSLSGTVISKKDVNKNGGIYNYMIKNGYDMFRFIPGSPDTGESYEVYKIDIPFTINLLDADAVVDHVVYSADRDPTIGQGDETAADPLPPQGDETATGSPPATPEQLAEIARLNALETSQNAIVETKTFRIAISIAQMSIHPAKIDKLKALIAGYASIPESPSGPILHSNVVITLSRSRDKGSLGRLMIDIVVPANYPHYAMMTKLNESMFSSITKFNTVINSQAMTGITATAITSLNPTSDLGPDEFDIYESQNAAAIAETSQNAAAIANDSQTLGTKISTTFSIAAYARGKDDRGIDVETLENLLAWNASIAKSGSLDRQGGKVGRNGRREDDEWLYLHGKMGGGGGGKDDIIITVTPPTSTDPAFVKIDMVVPREHSAIIMRQLNESMFSSIDTFNTSGIPMNKHLFPAEFDEKFPIPSTQNMTGMTALAIPVPIAFVSEGFGNMMSHFFGKKVKEGMTGLAYRGNVLLRLREGDYSNVLTKSGETLDITMKKSNIVLIQNGGLLVKPQNYVAPPAPPAPPVTPPKDNGGGQSTYIKDENGLYVAVNSQATNSCLIPGSDPALVTNNKCPFYPDTSMFETAMNNPSNPIVNPVNSMSPVDYSQTLFGPHATGLAANTPCSSCNNNQVPAATNNNSCSSNNVASTADDLVDDATVNDLVENPSAVPAVPTTPDATNAPNVPNVFNQINSTGNRMMAQNGNAGNGAGNAAATNSYSDFNGAFPEYVPNLNNNNAEPRPVLANFSTFGS